MLCCDDKVVSGCYYLCLSLHSRQQQHTMLRDAENLDEKRSQKMRGVWGNERYVRRTVYEKTNQCLGAMGDQD